MRGKKRKGADEPKKPKPKVPKHKPKESLVRVTKGRHKVNKIVAHFKLIVNLSHKKRACPSPFKDVMRIVCLVEEAADVFPAAVGDPQAAGGVLWQCCY
ncbi:hypothetical protein HaLaN_27276 [Haematococcus lacustris]|uniref:Uncharacterized protein n=1 Tax=Haematococcus lacustris TaxID=44745 RepID=A0A6A0A841_HAELA|nr:hypothetical protein HaLaN_27276 [Haematococcus lacustris]